MYWIRFEIFILNTKFERLSYTYIIGEQIWNHFCG